MTNNEDKEFEELVRRNAERLDREYRLLAELLLDLYLSHHDKKDGDSGSNPTGT